MAYLNETARTGAELVWEDEMPAIVSTYPFDGETVVSRNLEWISVTFSKEMGENFSVSTYWDSPSATGWPLSPFTAATWTRDRRTFHFSRDNIGKRLAPGIVIHVILNPSVHPSGFEDVSGNALNQYVFIFTTRKAKSSVRMVRKASGLAEEDS